MMPCSDTDISSYTEAPAVVKCLELLKAHEREHGPLIVSDVLDAYGHQYVNLVQKGGGVLGVALIGYTYILEKMGIRFLRLAGTSAGAINTALLAVIGKKEDHKSEKILEDLCNLELFKLVDGHFVARWLIKNIISDKGYLNRLQYWLTGMALSLLLLLVLSFSMFGLEKDYPILEAFTPIAFAVTGIAILLWLMLLLYLSSLLARFKSAGFGINPGNFFYDWIKERFACNKVFTVKDLEDKAGMKIPGLHLRPGREESSHDLKGDVTFIASELVTGSKIQFPAMSVLFRTSNGRQLEPAGFVRASMAIPLFFESYFINNIPQDDPKIQEAWLTLLDVERPPASARLVDGGLLSNFPINLFFNRSMKEPRLPTFGIDLDDAPSAEQLKEKCPDEKTSPPRKAPHFPTDLWSLPEYLSKMLSALRGYYDKDFLIQNRVYQKGVGKIDLSCYNWLNFFMDEETKIQLFIKGAESATEFLLNFDWEAYKQEQASMRKAFYSTKKTAP